MWSFCHQEKAWKHPIKITRCCSRTFSKDGICGVHLVNSRCPDRFTRTRNLFCNGNCKTIVTVTERSLIELHDSYKDRWLGRLKENGKKPPLRQSSGTRNKSVGYNVFDDQLHSLSKDRSSWLLVIWGCFWNHCSIVDHRTPWSFLKKTWEHMPIWLGAFHDAVPRASLDSSIASQFLVHESGDTSCHFKPDRASDLTHNLRAQPGNMGLWL